MSATRRGRATTTMASPAVRALLIVGLLSAAVVGGCGTGRRSEPLVGPPAISTDEERRGERLFMELCNQCHPGGAAGLAPALNNKPTPGGAVGLQIRKGLGRMPAFDDIVDDADIKAIVRYMKVVKKKRG